MFSNLRFKAKFIFLTMALVFSQVACNRYLDKPADDPTHSDDTLTIKTDEVSCLGDSAVQLQNFFEDKDDGQQLETAIGCIQNSLKTFAVHTRGVQADRYTGQEVQHFFNRYLLKDNQISDAFRNEILKFKMAVVGGDAQGLTRAEINELVDYLSLIRDLASSVKGHMKMLSFRESADSFRGQRFDQVYSQSKKVAEILLRRSKVTDSHYQWVDLVSLIQEVDRFVGHSASLQSIMDWLPLVGSVKVLFLGENAGLLTQTEWTSAASWVTDGYFLVLEYFYKIKPLTYRAPSEWNLVIKWAERGLKVLENSPELIKKNRLDAKAIDSVVEQVLAKNLFKTDLQASLINSFYRNAIAFLIEGQPGSRQDPSKIVGLTDSDLQIIKKEFHVWALSQKFINSSFIANPNQTLDSLRLAVDKYPRDAVIAEFTSDEQEATDLRRSWQDFVKLLKSSPNVIFDDKFEMQMGYFYQTKPMSYVGANMFNSIRTYIRFLFRGYSQGTARYFVDNYSTKSLLSNFVEDFYDFGKSIGFLDYRVTNPAPRTFVEANYFAFHGNGDDWLSSQEIFEELSVMVSGGQSQVKRIFNSDLMKKCYTGKYDVYKHLILNSNCFYYTFKDNVKLFMSNMPWMADEISRMSLSEYATFYNGLYTLAKMGPPSLLPEYKPVPEGYIEWNEVRSMTTIMHYIESIFMAYDKDQKGSLDIHEILNALPRYKALIDKKIESQSGFWSTIAIYIAGKRSIEEVALAYLVYRGRIPSAEDKMDLLSFYRDYDCTLDPGFTCNAVGNTLQPVHRAQLINVLSILKQNSN